MTELVRVAIRVDSSLQLGVGHIMRCLVLAEELRNHDCEVTFVSLKMLSALEHEVIKRGFFAVSLAERAEVDAFLKEKSFDVLIVDHYQLDHEWEETVAKYVKKLVVIDDLANRPHHADLLIDQNFYTQAVSRYEHLVAPDCQLLLGPKYSLLREKFASLHADMKTREKVSKIIVNFGGTDPENTTLWALKELAEAQYSGAVDVVIGQSHSYKLAVEQFCKDHDHFNCFVQPESFEMLMHNADLAIGAGGTTTWERCCLGLPCIIVSIADNQVEVAQNLAQAGAGLYLGAHDTIRGRQLGRAVDGVCSDGNKLYEMSQSAYQMVDGSGAKRVATAILALL